MESLPNIELPKKKNVSHQVKFFNSIVKAQLYITKHKYDDKSQQDRFFKLLLKANGGITDIKTDMDFVLLKLVEELEETKETLNNVLVQLFEYKQRSMESQKEQVKWKESLDQAIADVRAEFLLTNKKDST